MRTPQKLIHGKTGEPYYRVRYRRNGKQRALTFYGPGALRDAEDFIKVLDSLGADRAVAWWNSNLDRSPADGLLTLDAWWTRYLASLTGITDGTRTTYRRTYERVWAKPLGSLALDQIRREDIAKVINRLSAEKADKTVRNAYGILASCFKLAVTDGMLPANPCKGIRLPRRTEHTATEMRFLDHAEWLALYEALPAHYRPLFTFLAGTGARWGEAEALTVGDINLTARTVRINKAAKWDASKAARTVGPTKTRRSNRTLALPDEVLTELPTLIDGRHRTERLFLAPRGGPLRHRTVYDEWKAAVERAGLEPQPRIHDLRHTHVAWLIAAGISLPVIQDRLGHESIKTTVDRYGHLMPDIQQAAAAAASIAMRPRALN